MNKTINKIKFSHKKNLYQHLSRVKGFILPDIEHPYAYSITGEALYQDHLRQIVGQSSDFMIRMCTPATLNYEVSSQKHSYYFVYIQNLKVGRLTLDDSHDFIQRLKTLNFHFDDIFHANALIIEDFFSISKQKQLKVRLDIPYFIKDIEIKSYN